MMGVAWFGAFGPCGWRSVFFPHCSRYFFGPNTMSWTSLGDLFTKVTVVPDFTDSTFG